MMRLRGSDSVFICGVLLLVGCVTSSYKVSKQYDMGVEFHVTPDRILLECEEIVGDEVVYGFMIHVLDDKNTVLTLAQGNRLDKKTCYGGIEYINKILRRGKNIYIAGIGKFESGTSEKVYEYKFPGLGTYPSNNKSFQFMFIANEYGTCYGAYSGVDKPCPNEPFPLK